MHNVIDYYNQKEKKITTALHKIINGESSHFSRGCICLLKKLQLKVNLFWSHAVSAYSSVISVTDLESQDNCALNDISDSSSSEDECDIDD